MRAVVIHAPKDLRIEDYPDPSRPARARCASGSRNGGICGSDLHYYHHGGFGTVRIQQPMALGHEIAGVVEDVGDGVTGVTAGHARRGQSEPAVRPVPAIASEGMRNQCLDMRFIGSAMRFPHVQGGFREIVTVDAGAGRADRADERRWREAAMAEPLAVCLHAATRPARCSASACW